MKSSLWGLLVLAVGLVVGMLVGSGALQRRAEAQVPIPPAPQRYQISAWAFPPQRGCYIVDTQTGELWHAAADGQPKKISEKIQNIVRP